MEKGKRSDKKSNNNANNNNKAKNIFSSLLTGVTMGYGITAMVFIIYAILLTYTKMTESHTQLIVMLTTVAAVVVAGTKTSMSAESRGWLYGMLSGFLYAVIMIMLGIVLSPELCFNMKTVTILVLSVTGGGLGGIIGINIKK